MMVDSRSAAFGVAPPPPGPPGPPPPPQHTLPTGIPANPSPDHHPHHTPRAIDPYDFDAMKRSFDGQLDATKRARPNNFMPQASPALMNSAAAGAGGAGTGADFGFAGAAGATGANSQACGFGTPSVPQSAFNMTQASPMMNMGMGMGAMSGAATGNMNNMGMQTFSPMPNSNQMMNTQSQSPGANSNSAVGRTVYVGNLPADASVDELLTQVRFGPIENVRILPEKSCAFISFLDPNTAAAFHSDALMRKVSLHGQELKVGWGKPSAVPPNILQAIQNNGATRNVYLGQLDDDMTETQLRDELSKFGAIDQVKIVRDKNIGFVHFLSIQTAIKAVQALSSDPAWAGSGKRANFGKDRCAYVPKSQHQQQQHNLAAAQMAANAASFANSYAAMPGYGGNMQVGGHIDPSQLQPGNRTVYLGNVHPETTTEEICNTIRGGILQQIRYIQDKHIAFVTFVDPNAALAFFTSATLQGISIHNRRLKIGWGKHSGPPSPGIAMVVQAGGSRNTYIGQIQDWDTYTEEKLRNDFGSFGEIELVNLLKEKNCAFVNFTNISNAIKAIEAMKSHPDYQDLKIAYGKDRCGNPPRSGGYSHSPHNKDGEHDDANGEEIDATPVEVSVHVNPEDIADTTGSPGL